MNFETIAIYNAASPTGLQCLSFVRPPFWNVTHSKWVRQPQGLTPSPVSDRNFFDSFKMKRPERRDRKVSPPAKE